MSTPPFPDRMVARLAPSGGASHEAAGAMSVPVTHAPEFEIVVTAQDGITLLRLGEANGRLVIEGDESRWDEAAKRFLYQMMQWSGLVGIQWKNQVIKAAGGST